MSDAIDAAPPLSLLAAEADLAQRIDAFLPQTQCTRCGYAGCRPYADAIASGRAEINQCPPGGAAGIARLSALTGRPVLPLNAAHGREGPLRVALIDEALCIGCTLCIQACPVDAIVGAARRMHTVLPALCTGCDLCIPPCPMDCIAMIVVQPPRRWTDADASAARARFEARRVRLARERVENEKRGQRDVIAQRDPAESGPDDAPLFEDKKARVAAAIERARARRAQAAAARLLGESER